MKTWILFGWIMLGLLGPLPAQAGSVDEAACIAVARQFAEQLDAGDVAGAWLGLDAHSRQLEPGEAWQQRQAAIRAVYGPLLERQGRAVTTRGSYAYHPDGQYVVVTLTSRFVAKQAAIETVVLRQEPSGLLTIISYHIN